MNDATLFEFQGLFGFRVQVHRSIILLVLLFGFFGFAYNPAYALITISVVLGSIYLHEMGHAWACKTYRIPVREVVLYGGGGYVLPGRSLTRREDEFVTAMGPIVNLALWAIASLALPYVGHGLVATIVFQLAWINLFLAIFNLLPMLPLDGGRLSGLVLARIFPQRAATRIAGAFGLLTGVMWLAYAAFSLLLGGGFLLLFLPNLPRHWQMLREGA